MIEILGVQAGYGWGPLHRPVLRHVDLSATPGQVTAVVGPNGVGKTTLFRTLLGFLRPTRGSVRIQGLPPRAYRRRHGIAFLPESTPVPEGWTFDELLEEGSDLQGLAGARRKQVIEVARRRSGLLPDEGRRSLSSLSKGTARRAVLAYALLGDPAVVLLDEPLSGLDPGARRGVREVVEELVRAGSTILMTSHELGEVASLATRATVLREGRVALTLEEPVDGSELERAVLDGKRREQVR